MARSGRTSPLPSHVARQPGTAWSAWAKTATVVAIASGPLGW